MVSLQCLTNKSCVGQCCLNIYGENNDQMNDFEFRILTNGFYTSMAGMVPPWPYLMGLLAGIIPISLYLDLNLGYLLLLGLIPLGIQMGIKR